MWFGVMENILKALGTYIGEGGREGPHGFEV